MTERKALQDKVVVVTGAGRGIGAAVALEAARQGARVVVNDVGAALDGATGGAIGGPSPGEEVAGEIRRLGGEAVVSTDSVADPAAAARIVQAALDAFGRIDAVVNNAGILRDAVFHKMSVADWDSVIGVHLMGSFYVSRAAAQHFRQQESGAFVHLTSTSGLVGNVGQANYAAAKLGIVGLSKSIALDMKRFNVRSNCIAPWAYTRMIASIPTTTPEQQARVEKIKQMTPDKIAVMAAYLASDLAAGVSGQIFGVRNNEIFLFSQHRMLRSVHRGEGWSVATISSHAMPALKPSFYPLDVTTDVFGWDPV
jgi:NAD(P)-dependent dehydrogenase (short-subunit alcohol dehydrogenase family)